MVWQCSRCGRWLGSRMERCHHCGAARPTSLRQRVEHWLAATHGLQEALVCLSNLEHMTPAEIAAALELSEHEVAEMLRDAQPHVAAILMEAEGRD